MEPHIPGPQLPITPHLTLASVLAMNAELNARNDLLLASLRKVAAEDDAFRQKHLGCDLTIEALQEENESLRKELKDRTKKFERGLKAEEVGAGSSKRRSETVRRSGRVLRQKTSHSPSRKEDIAKAIFPRTPTSTSAHPSAPISTSRSVSVPTKVAVPKLPQPVAKQRAPPGVLSIPTSIHSSFAPIDPTLKGQEFYEFLRSNRYIRDYDDNYYHCYCKSEDPTMSTSKKHKGYSHLHDVGKPFRAGRWCAHAERCAYVKDPTKFHGL